MIGMPRHFLFILVFLFCIAGPVKSEVIDAFSYPASEAAAMAWRAIDGTPPAAMIPGSGLAFPIPFATDRDRVYWDRDGMIDLSGYSGFELELTCNKPQAMRSLSIYFRSGLGWYIWNQPLPAAGRQRIQLPKSQFSTEGQPSGWDKIDKIRFSPWKGKAINTSIVAHHFSGRRENLYVIQSTVSAPNNTERGVARRTTERISRWLKECGIPHAVVPEEQLDKACQDASLLVLPYNPKIPTEKINALQDFANRGGKMLVCYSSDDRLAGLMGVQLGAVTNTRDIARWRGMSFGENAPAGIPASVHQQS